MIYPYMTNETCGIMQRFAYNDDGIMIKMVEVNRARVEPVECKQEECAAWQNGCCQRRG